MKNIHLLLFILITMGTTGTNAQKNIYESERFQELGKEHLTLAIIPFLTHLDLKDNISDQELKDLEGKEGYAVQNALETYFSKRKKKKKFSVEFQNTEDTNALLNQNKISYDNIDVYTVRQLSEILRVDGIISGTIDLNVLLSKGIPTEFNLMDYINGNANYGRIGIKISDGPTGKLLWKYEKQIDKKSGKNTTDLIDLMMKQASKKFPYDRERPRDKKRAKES
jgi:hypothetical protein